LNGSLSNSKYLGLLWALLSTALLVLILKPYNKGKDSFKKPDYQWYSSSPDSAGYAIDYDGTIDLVSYGEAFYTEVQGKNNRFDLRLKVHYKKGNHPTLFKYYLNGYLADSAWLKPNESWPIETILRRNDYLKLEITPVKGSAEVGVKLEKTTQSRQTRFYFVVFIWLASALILLLWKQWVHAILPSCFFLLATYAEHLYTDMFQLWTLLGFILVALGLSGIGSQLKFVFPKRKKWAYIIWDLAICLMVVFCALFVVHYAVFGFRMDYDSIVAILQSNKSETWEFLRIHLKSWRILVLLAILLIPIGTTLLQIRKNDDDVVWWPIALVLLLIGLGISIDSRFVHEWREANAQYTEELEKFNIVQSRFNKPKNINASKHEEGETYLVVIGESQSKEHMSLYGYHKQTTPYLDKLKANGDLLVLDSAYSCHTHTVLVLQNALTQANQYNLKEYTEMPSLINVLNAADFETVWISNQVKLSNWDNIVSAIASSCDKEFFVNKNIGETIDNSPYDDAVLPRLKSYLDEETDKNRVIFVHLMGNHGKYNYRYPEDATKLRAYGMAEYGSQSSVESWEYYDNSILYNDSIVHEIIKILKESPGQAKLLSYFADHGEDLREGRGHNSGKYTHRMVQIPVFFWWDSAYYEKHLLKAEAVGKNRTKLWSNDLFHDVFLDLAGVHTKHKDTVFSLTNPDFKLINPRVKNGYMPYLSSDNPYAFLQKNIVGLSNEDVEFGAHRCNSIAKAHQALQKGLSCIEIDVVIREELPIPILEVGHGEAGTMSGMDLKDFLDKVPGLENVKVWLDIKNLHAGSMKILRAKLDELNVLYPVKSRWVIESSTRDLDFYKIAEAGYHTSYYLPTSLLDQNESTYAREANKIANQIRNQKVHAVSFDHGLYFFVDEYLKYKTSVSNFHTWDLSASLGAPDLLQHVSRSKYVKDRNIKTVLFTFPSANNL
jgi:heptose-I-phosphate ethanolaminephosphotransferase